MLSSTITTPLATLRQAFAGAILSNRINPIHLSVATTIYRIQSQTLHIPDHIGFFSPGPPRLQAHEARHFLALMLMTYVCQTAHIFVIFLLWLLFGKLPPWRLVAFFASLTIGHAVMMWAMVVFYDRPRRTAPGYDWGDWKVQQD